MNVNQIIKGEQSMRYKILSILAIFSLSACSTVDGASEDLSSAWSSITNIGGDEALKDYTAVIYQHSQEPIANYSFQTMQVCHISNDGLSEEELLILIQKDYELAKRCWDMLLDYPSKDVRFFKEGSVEHEVLQEFEANKSNYAALFTQK